MLMYHMASDLLNKLMISYLFGKWIGKPFIIHVSIVRQGVQECHKGGNFTF